MAYASVGNNNGAGSAQELFEQKMMTDVLKYFKVTNVVRELITVKNITQGKSASFPIVGNSSAALKTNDAEELAVQTVKHTDRIINIQGLLVGHSYVTDIDNAMLHYDPKAAHTESIGRSLSKYFDVQGIGVAIAAAKIVDSTTATAAGLKDFSDDKYTEEVEITLANILSGGAIYGACAAAMTEYRSKDIVGDPTFLLRTAQYFALLNNSAQTGITWVNDPYVQSGKVPMVLGSKVVYSPHFPAGTGASGAIATGDYLGLLFSKEAVGCVELLSTSVRSDYVPTRLATLIVGKMAYGMDILNHSAAVGIKAGS